MTENKLSCRELELLGKVIRYGCASSGCVAHALDISYLDLHKMLKKCKVKIYEYTMEDYKRDMETLDRILGR